MLPSVEFSIREPAARREGALRFRPPTGFTDWASGGLAVLAFALLSASVGCSGGKGDSSGPAGTSGSSGTGGSGAGSSTGGSASGGTLAGAGGAGGSSAMAGSGGVAEGGGAGGTSAGTSGAAGGDGGGAGGSGGSAPKGLSFVPAEGITSVALSVNPDGVVLPMKLHNGGPGSASITELSVSMGNAFQLEPSPTLPRDLPAGQDLELMIRFAPSTSATATFEGKLSATADAGMASAGLFGLAMNAQNSEAALAQVVQTLGYEVNVGGTTTTLGTGSAPIGDEVAAPRFVKAGNMPVVFQVVARYSPFEAAPYGYYTGAGPNVTRTQLGIMSRGPEDNVANRTLLPPLDAGAMGSFDPGAEAFGIFAESQSNTSSLGSDGRFYQEDSLNDDQGSVQPVHRMRVYPLKDRGGAGIPNSYLIACEEASNSDYQDYVFVISGVSIQN